MSLQPCSVALGVVAGGATVGLLCLWLSRRAQGRQQKQQPQQQQRQQRQQQERAPQREKDPTRTYFAAHVSTHNYDVYGGDGDGDGGRGVVGGVDGDGDGCGDGRGPPDACGPPVIVCNLNSPANLGSIYRLMGCFNVNRLEHVYTSAGRKGVPREPPVWGDEGRTSRGEAVGEWRGALEQFRVLARVQGCPGCWHACSDGVCRRTST